MADRDVGLDEANALDLDRDPLDVQRRGIQAQGQLRRATRPNPHDEDGGLESQAHDPQAVLADRYRN